MAGNTALANVSVNTQSSIRVEMAGGVVVRFDPLHVDGEPHDADFVFVTHEHFDHLSPDDLAKVVHAETTVVVPNSLVEAVRKTFAGAIVGMGPGEGREFAPTLSVRAIAAYNLASRFHPKGNGWLGYVVSDGTTRYCAMGDTDGTPEAREAAASCDVAFVPIGGTYTMDAGEAAAFVNATKPPVVVPIHYGSYAGSPSDVDEFEGKVDSPVRVVPKLAF